jgi:hypothetical protein
MKRLFSPTPTPAGLRTASGIEILDETGEVVARLETQTPQWSFDQWCRNRATAGYSWRPV